VLSRESDYAQVPRPPEGPAGSSPQRRVPWGVLDCLGVFAVTVIAVVVLAMLVSALVDAFDLPDEVGLVMLPLPLATLGVVTLGWVHIRHRAVSALTGSAPGGIRELAIGAGLGGAAFFAVNVGLGITVQLIAAALGLELPQPQQELREAAVDPGLLPLIIVSAVIVAPLAEEVFFRGMLFQALRGLMGRWGAILASAVVFAAAHVLAEPTGLGGALVFVMILPLGVFLGWLFDRRGALSAVVAVHAAFNALTVAVMVAAARSGVLG
jgi:uncharacterized protein